MLINKSCRIAMHALVKVILETGVVVLGSVLAMYTIATATMFFGLKGAGVGIAIFMLFGVCAGSIQDIYLRDRLQLLSKSPAPPNAELMGTMGPQSHG